MLAVLAIALGASLAFEGRDYDRAPFQTGGREDRRVTGEVSMTFLEAEYMGFNPTVNLRVSRNSSTVDLYDQRDIGVTVGIRSAF